jgi:hypothetical protein
MNQRVGSQNGKAPVGAAPETETGSSAPQVVELRKHIGG